MLLNRSTTLALDTLWLVALGGLAGLGFSIAVVYYWFAPREDLPDVPAWHLKNDAPGRWFLVGVAMAATIGCVGILAAYAVVETAAQYLPGPTRQIQGTVIDGPFNYGRRCTSALDVAVGHTRELRLCARPRLGEPTLSGSVRKYQVVTVTVRDTPLGTTLVSIAASGT
jgi:hypothetical protein